MSAKSYFDRVAPEWESMRGAFFSEAVRDRALSAVRMEPGQSAADLGSGSGFMTEALLRFGLRVIAVDQSEAMLAVLANRLGHQGALETRVGEAEHLPLRDAEVDHTFANMLLHHVEHPQVALREMARVVHTGGNVVVTDMDEHDFTFLLTEHHDRWLGFPRRSVGEWFEAAGLVDIRVECAGETCSATSQRGDLRASVSLFLAYGRKPEA